MQVLMQQRRKPNFNKYFTDGIKNMKRIELCFILFCLFFVYRPSNEKNGIFARVGVGRIAFCLIGLQR